MTRWGMVVDVDRCTGCDACVVACQEENNIQIVGEEEAANGRAMHWLRIERYVEGEFPDARVTFRPVLCQHCGEAPCEPVCPVYATYHTEDGLNAMVYARCVGTRYCANNCPYTVRTFNWFDPEWPAPLDRQLNPDVSPRVSGVMEKCTFCVQRIQTRGAHCRRRTGARSPTARSVPPAPPPARPRCSPSATSRIPRAACRGWRRARAPRICSATSARSPASSISRASNGAARDESRR